MKHYCDCERKFSESKDAREAFLEKYPKACQKCGGWGVVTWEENQAPLGSGERWMMEMSELCGDCIDNGKCPRCGAHWREDCAEQIYSNEFPCEECGWNWGKNPGDTIPKFYECYCWEREEDDYIDYDIDYDPRGTRDDGPIYLADDYDLREL